MFKFPNINDLIPGQIMIYDIACEVFMYLGPDSKKSMVRVLRLKTFEVENRKLKYFVEW